jgi:hypothetical protein
MTANQTDFRRQLDALPSWQQRAQKIGQAIAQKSSALASRNEKLLALRGDFDALTLEFWSAFRRSLEVGEKGPDAVAIIGIVLATGVAFFLVAALSGQGSLELFVVTAVGTLCVFALFAHWKARSERIAKIVRTTQEPFWLTSGSIALSNLSLSPPAGAAWWWPDRIAFVFVSHLAVRFSIDAKNCSLIWEAASSPWLTSADQKLEATQATKILTALFLNNSRYQQMVKSFSSLAALDEEYSFLESLKTEADANLAEEQRAARLQATQQKVTEGGQACFNEQGGARPQAADPKAPGACWDDLIVPRSLRENLQAYCRILRDFKLIRLWA